jgi:hypothetical protein
VTPQEAINILSQVVQSTRALPQEVDLMREALKTLAPKEAPKE